MDLGLILRRKKTGEILLAAGGRWHTLERRYLTDEEGRRLPPRRVRFIDLEESQVEFTRWFATFIADLREGRQRDVSLALAAGDRRGGKTFDLLLCTIALLIDIPRLDNSPTLGWVVSVSFQEREEIDRTITEWIPKSWYTPWRAPEFKYQFLTGSTLKNVSADDPETLKRGRVDVILYNEAQKMSVAALTNGIYGTADKGGIALLAANPPRRMVGKWVLELREAIDDGQVAGVKYFGFSSKDNERIDQASRHRVAGIVRVLDPKASKADDEDQWLPIGDFAYPEFQRKKHVLARWPDVMPQDITRDFLRRRVGRAYANAGGVDFQGTPHHAGIIAHLWGPVEAPIVVVVDEVFADNGTEDDFLDELEEKCLLDEAGVLDSERPYDPGNLFWVGDASGQWQDGKHDFSGGRNSFDVFKKRRWHIRPPMLKRKETSEFSKNPHIENRLGLVNKMLKADRVLVYGPNCPRLVEALKECPMAIGKFKRLKPYGLYSHVTDALGYLLYFLFPPERVQIQAGDSPRGGTFPEYRPGGRTYTGY